MAEDKKYYWLKLKKDFFKRHDIKIIEDMDNGKDYILFYLKLLCESVDHEGCLRFSETIPYNEKMLSTITNTNIDIVRSALKVFRELNMLEVLEDRTIFMTECQKMLGSETYWAERKRIQRSNNLIGQCPTNVQLVQPMSRQEIDIEKEIDKDKEVVIEERATTTTLLKQIFPYLIEDEPLIDKVDIEVLKKKISESRLLKTIKFVKVSWINRHYYLIANDYYKDFEFTQDKKTFSSRSYTEEDMNNLFDNLDDIKL